MSHLTGIIAKSGRSVCKDKAIDVGVENAGADSMSGKSQRA